MEEEEAVEKKIYVWYFLDSKAVIICTVFSLTLMQYIVAGYETRQNLHINWKDGDFGFKKNSITM